MTLLVVLAGAGRLFVSDFRPDDIRPLPASCRLSDTAAWNGSGLEGQDDPQRGPSSAKTRPFTALASHLVAKERSHHHTNSTSVH